MHLCLCLLTACLSKEKTGSAPEPSDSVTLVKQKEARPTEAEPTEKTPIDTIVAYSGGKKLHLFVLESHDSLPSKPIKDFEVLDAESNESIFRSVSKRLALGHETDPISGYFDSLFVIPTYSIASRNPLTVDLNFIVDGQLWTKYLMDLTYAFYEGRPMDTLSFLRYTFQSTNSMPIVQSSLRFTPHKCNVTETELMA